MYKSKENDTKTTENELKEIMLLCTKDVFFMFFGKTYSQIEEVGLH